MEVIFGILAAFLQFNFFSTLFFAGIFYVLYFGTFEMVMGAKPALTGYYSTVLPPLNAGIDGMAVFIIYLFFIIFVLIMIYHITTYWVFWSGMGILFLGVFVFQVISGMGGVSSFLMFILKIGGILLAIALVLLLLFAGSLIIWDRKETKKYEKIKT